MIGFGSLALLWLACGMPRPSSAPDERWWVFGREGEEARLWEFLPAEGRLVGRATFGESPWAADLLFSDGDGPPDLLRWQRRVPGERRHVVELHRIDPQTNAVRFLARGGSLTGLAASMGVCWVQTEEGILRFDLADERFRPLERPFRLVRPLERHWLVHCDDVTDPRAFHLFDPATGSFAGAFSWPEPLDAEGFGLDAPWIGVGPDGATLALVAPVAFDDVPSFGEPARVLPTTLHVLDLRGGASQTVPLPVRVRGGSGRPVLYPGSEVGFAADGRLVFRDPGPADRGPDAPSRWRALVRESDAPFAWRVAPASDDALPKREPRVRYVPPTLDPALAAGSELDLLAAYLRRAGHPTPFRVEREGRVSTTWVPLAISADGRRWLAQVAIASLGADFVYVDLEADRLVPIRAPGIASPNLRCVSLGS